MAFMFMFWLRVRSNSALEKLAQNARAVANLARFARECDGFVVDVAFAHNFVCTGLLPNECV